MFYTKPSLEELKLLDQYTLADMLEMHSVLLSAMMREESNLSLVKDQRELVMNIQEAISFRKTNDTFYAHAKTEQSSPAGLGENTHAEGE